ncbi:hypothetical protein HY995_05890 [Candidatus Micrarchaeota archaeon]|nr:hypothetical protein [Candidatus Micrarchaeota archaeon]MBI5177585.1 hypothetical protein [Candidatus Micrarchaeota archaeon]
MIEDEITHWFKDDKGETHRTSLRIESEASQLVKGFPRDGIVALRITNSIGAMSFRLSPDEALRLSTLLNASARDLLLKKRVLWQQLEE